MGKLQEETEDSGRLCVQHSLQEVKRPSVMMQTNQPTNRLDVYQKGATEFHGQLAPEPLDIIISDTELQKAKSLLLPPLSF